MPATDLGQQRPQRTNRRGFGPLFVSSYGFCIALLIGTKINPEVWLLQWFDLEPLFLATGLPSPLSAALIGVLVVAAGASYRPMGGLLGFGAIPLPALVLVSGSATASLVCFLGTLASASILRRLSKRDPQAPKDRRGLQRILLDSTQAAFATLVAGIAWALLVAQSPLLATVLSTGLWLLASHGLERIQHRSRNLAEAPRANSPTGKRFGLLWDALGWVLAASLALMIVAVGPAAVLPALFGYLVLTVVGAHRELDRTLHLRRIRDLRHLGSMAQRLVPRERASELASQCLEEVRRTIEFSHFELRFESSSGSEAFHAHTQGPLREGTEEVSEHPPVAPGIHTRRSWTMIERDLLSTPVKSRRGQDSENAFPEPPQRLGRLRLWIDPRHGSDDDEALISDLVPQIAALIDRSRLDREARVDALTGLTRRHVFDRELSRRLEFAREEGYSVALLLFDLDHFKQVNDNYGHDAGDRVLEAISTILLKASNPGGLACRWGGEELALLQWGSGHNALLFAEELRRFIAEQEIATDAGILSVTTSVGVVSFPDILIEEPADMVKLADEALYAAKDRGRNRALLACGRGRFKSPSGELVGELESLGPGDIPQL